MSSTILAGRVDVDAFLRRLTSFGRLGIGLASSPLHRDDPAGAGVRAQLADGQREAGGRADQGRVVREREVRLRHADGDGGVEGLGLGTSPRSKGHAGGAVGPGRDRLDLGGDRRVERIEGAELGRRGRRGRDDRFGELRRSHAAALEPLVDRDALHRSQRCRAASISAALSLGKRLMATTHGRPKAWTTARAARRFENPRSSASRPPSSSPP